LPALPDDVTQLLIKWSRGDKAALDELMPVIHSELRRLARRYMAKERPGHTLQTTALINEAYLRLVDQQSVQWQDRAHFFAVAAQVMRHILVDHARKYQSDKRGAGAQKLALDDVAVANRERAAELVALDEALENLAAMDQRQSQIVELRFFGGLTVDETAGVMKLAPITVMREWRLAKAWLRNAIAGSDDSVSD
jgi:RNA polymerase sigma factor (TIGR02999 family)